MRVCVRVRAKEERERERGKTETLGWSPPSIITFFSLVIFSSSHSLILFFSDPLILFFSSSLLLSPPASFSHSHHHPHQMPHMSESFMGEGSIPAYNSSPSPNGMSYSMSGRDSLPAPFRPNVAGRSTFGHDRPSSVRPNDASINTPSSASSSSSSSSASSASSSMSSSRTPGGFGLNDLGDAAGGAGGAGRGHHMRAGTSSGRGGAGRGRSSKAGGVDSGSVITPDQAKARFQRRKLIRMATHLFNRNAGKSIKVRATRSAGFI